jgi:hypothetical protein
MINLQDILLHCKRAGVELTAGDVDNVEEYLGDKPCGSDAYYGILSLLHRALDRAIELQPQTKREANRALREEK